MVGVDTFLLVKDGQRFDRTDAALEIAKDLSGLWHWLCVFKVLPRPLSVRADFQPTTISLAFAHSGLVHQQISTDARMLSLLPLRQ